MIWIPINFLFGFRTFIVIALLIITCYTPTIDSRSNFWPVKLLVNNLIISIAGLFQIILYFLSSFILRIIFQLFFLTNVFNFILSIILFLSIRLRVKLRFTLVFGLQLIQTWIFILLILLCSCFLWWFYLWLLNLMLKNWFFWIIRSPLF